MNGKPKGKGESVKGKDKKFLYPSPFTLSPSAGFTLIELLVVIGLLGLLMVVGTNAFVGVLRSSTKASIINKIRENGDTAVETMSRRIQNASAIIIPDAPDATQCLKWIVIQNKLTSPNDKLYTKFVINQDLSATTNGYIGISTGDSLSVLTAAPLTAQPFTDNSAAPAAVDVLPDVLPAGGGYQACFRVVPYSSTSGSFNVVIVNFNLKQSKQVPNGRQEFSAAIPFRTTFTLRVY